MRDGQQRLSSLMYALTAPDLSLKDSSARRWYFVNLDVLLDEPDSDEVVFDRSKRELRGLNNIEMQYTQRMLPCTALLTQQGFYQWRDGFEDWLRANAPAELDRYRSEWRDGWTKAAADFQTFEVPLVELPRVDEADCVRGRRARRTSTSLVYSCFVYWRCCAASTRSHASSSTCGQRASRRTGGVRLPRRSGRWSWWNSSGRTASASLTSACRRFRRVPDISHRFRATL